MKRVLFLLPMALFAVAVDTREALASYRGVIESGTCTVQVDGNDAAVMVTRVEANALVLAGYGTAKTVQSASLTIPISTAAARLIIEVDPPPNGSARLTLIQGTRHIEDATLVAGDTRFVYDVTPVPTGVVEPAPFNAQLKFEASTPNPFGVAIQFAYTLPSAGPVRLAIFDVSGHEVATLVNGMQSVGRHALTWDGGDARRSQQSSGVYFARLEFGGGVAMQRVVRAR